MTTQRKNKFFYIEAKTDREPIIHLIFAKDRSEAGNHYNATSSKYLKAQIVTQKRFKKFDLIDSVKDFWKDNCMNYLEIDDTTVQENPSSSNVLELEYKPEPGIIQLKNKVKYKIKPVEYDFLGERRLIKQFATNEFTPDYSMIVTDDLILLTFDLPELDEMTEPVILRKQNGAFFHLQASKAISKRIEELKENNLTFESNRKFGRVDMMIRVGTVDLNWDENIKFEYENGVAEFEIKISGKKDGKKALFKK